MADETTSEEQSVQSIWEKLGITDPDEEYVAEEASAEGEADKEDKLLKKLASRQDNLEAKFRNGKLQEAKDKYLASADPLEADLFKTIAGDCKDPEQLDHAIELVKARSAEMKENMAKAEEEARKQVERVWGVSNPGMPAQPASDDEKARIAKALEAGDTKVGFQELIGDDPFLAGHR